MFDNLCLIFHCEQHLQSLRHNNHLRKQPRGCRCSLMPPCLFASNIGVAACAPIGSRDFRSNIGKRWKFINRIFPPFLTSLLHKFFLLTTRSGQEVSSISKGYLYRTNPSSLHKSFLLQYTNSSSLQPEAGRKFLLFQRVICTAQILPPCTDPSSYSTQILPPCIPKRAGSFFYFKGLSVPHKSFLLMVGKLLTNKDLQERRRRSLR